MPIKLTIQWKTKVDWLKFLIIIILLIGIFLRFVNLDQKAYSSDEVRTLLRTSGYTSEELTKQEFDGDVISPGDLLKYQHPVPEKGIAETISSLAQEDVHPPLYFVMLRYWMQSFGNSAVVTRGFSALLSILMFPCLYWLCLELFNSPLTGWIASALIAVSPFHLLHAQEARPYSLWALGILLSSAALLRAVRLNTGFSWIVYAATVILGIYAHINFAFVAISQGIYVIVIERFRLSKTLAAYSLASLVGVLFFFPWLWVVLNNWNKIKSLTTWITSFKTSLPDRMAAWISNLCSIFIDFNEQYLINKVLDFFILILVIYSLYLLCKNAPRQAYLLIITLIFITTISQVIPDLIWGGRRSVVARYLTPSYLGIELAVAYLIASKITAISGNLRYQRLWQFIMVILISTGVISCVIISQAPTARVQGSTPRMNLQVARTINQTSQPLVISDTFYPYLLSLSHLLDSKVKLQLVNKPDISPVIDGFSDVFLYYPSRSFQQKLSQNNNYKLETIVAQPDKGRLWLLKLKKYG
ncbi:MAG TPA: hypothetical protein DDZ80_23835 [Cyanobacteria bacterium UBA8803]|nr:hypothetical protein [Cyanobacteria bacterium UBA9273]HBL61348.1 hypothetical protein [Cyanobacteria bacterium UBA8803]